MNETERVIRSLQLLKEIVNEIKSSNPPETHNYYQGFIDGVQNCIDAITLLSKGMDGADLENQPHPSQP